MKTATVAGQPCWGCDRPMVPSHTPHRPDGHVMHSARGLCGGCYRRTVRPVQPTPPVERVERVTDSLLLQRLPVEPLLLSLHASGITRTNHPLWTAIDRGRHNGYVSAASADRIAVRMLGRHPAEIWGEAWWAAT